MKSKPRDLASTRSDITSERKVKGNIGEKGAVVKDDRTTINKFIWLKNINDSLK